jgi:excisionase family DNA binding protein
MKPARKSAAASRESRPATLTVKVEIDPLVEVVRRHVKLSARAKRLIEGDFARMFRSPALVEGTQPRATDRSVRADPVLTTQEAADLVGVSRPYIVARIEAGDIMLHQQVGNQRRVLKSTVEAWHRREQARRRRALGKLGDELDGEIFARKSR